MKNLISNTVFGKQLTEKYLNGFYNLTEYQRLRSNFDDFLSRQPQLSDFVACGEDGLPIEKPSEHLENRTLYYKELEAYQQALDKVLFKGFEVCNDNEEFTRLKLNNDTLFFITFYKESEMVVFNTSGGNQPYITTLESLTPYNLELTENGNKIIGV